MYKYSRLVAASALIAVVGSVSVPVMAQTVASPTTTWNGINYGGGDPAGDQQTGLPASDIVGNASNPFLFSLYQNDTLYFRIRLNEGGASFAQVAAVGFIFNNNTTAAGGNNPQINFFAGVNNVGGNRVHIWSADPSKTNISPSTSGIGNALFTYTQTAQNYYYAPVSAVNEPTPGSPVNFGSGSTADYFLGFAIPFADFASAAATAGVGGVTSTTPFRLAVFTSAQANQLNQDIGGSAGATTLFGDPTGNSGLISASALTPTPAPPGVVSGLIGIAMGGAQFGFMRFRRRRAKKTETTEATEVAA